MAGVIKDTAERNGKKRSPFWYCAFTDATGRRLKKSTGLTSKTKAMQMCMQWQRAADLARQRALTEERAREVISEIVASVHGEGLRTFTVRQWFDHFRRIKADSQNPKTAVRYAQIEREFCGFIGPKADLNILAITSADVRAFRDHRKATAGLSATTLNGDITILSAIFNGAWRDHIISNNPCTAVSPIKDTIPDRKRRKKPFNVEQVSALLKAAEGDWKGLILVAFYTGARLNDCANLRWRHVDLLSPIKKLTFEVAKTGDEIQVPMHRALEDYLLSLSAPKSDEVFLFPSLAGRRATNLSKQFSRLMEAARIGSPEIRKRGQGAARSVHALSFHSLRRSFVSILASANVPEERRMELTGHVTRDIHKRYTEHQLAQLQEAITLLPSL
jgi:integrase